MKDVQMAEEEAASACRLAFTRFYPLGNVAANLLVRRSVLLWDFWGPRMEWRHAYTHGGC